MTKTVMLVDDDPLILRVVSTILDIEEYEVVAFESAAEALEAIAVEPPGVLVTDVMMPDMDGFELTRAVRANPVHANLPIVLLTARTSDEDRAEGKLAGGDAYLTKPFSPLELIEIIEGLLARPAVT